MKSLTLIENVCEKYSLNKISLENFFDLLISSGSRKRSGYVWNISGRRIISMLTKPYKRSPKSYWKTRCWPGCM